MLAPSPPRAELELLNRMVERIGDLVYVPRKFVREMRSRGFILTDGLSGPSDWAVLMTYVGKPENAGSNKQRAAASRHYHQSWAFADRKLAEARGC